MDSVMHWTARIVGLLLALVVLAFAIGEGLPVWSTLTPSERLQTVGLVVMVAGAVAGWKWPVAGGVLLLGGYALFQSVEFRANGKMAGGAFWIFAVSGVLYLLSAWMHRPART